jgi:hypothetical protein
MKKKPLVCVFVGNILGMNKLYSKKTNINKKIINPKID